MRPLVDEDGSPSSSPRVPLVGPCSRSADSGMADPNFPRSLRFTKTAVLAREPHADPHACKTELETWLENLECVQYAETVQSNDSP